MILDDYSIIEIIYQVALRYKPEWMVYLWLKAQPRSKPKICILAMCYDSYNLATLLIELIRMLDCTGIATQAWCLGGGQKVLGCFWIFMHSGWMRMGTPH